MELMSTLLLVWNMLLRVFFGGGGEGLLVKRPLSASGGARAGVGHCLQVGCPESGIDEAVARLVAAGYKVRAAKSIPSPA